MGSGLTVLILIKVLLWSLRPGSIPVDTNSVFVQIWSSKDSLPELESIRVGSLTIWFSLYVLKIDLRFFAFFLFLTFSLFKLYKFPDEIIFLRGSVWQFREIVVVLRFYNFLTLSVS